MSAPRCKPGQLARYVGTDPRCTGWIVFIVKLHERGTAMFGEPMWITEPSFPADFGTGDAQAIADRLLKPLDNPGDDEVDEISLRRVIPEGVPA